MSEHFFHMFANGDDAKNFITSKEDFKAAFNRIAVCSVLCGVKIVAASVEDSHPHILLWGSEERSRIFMKEYAQRSIRHIVNQRGSADGVLLNCELYKVEDESYLRNVAAYVIVQATKDGKQVMPYDYLYGTGALYFRAPGTILPWNHDEEGRPVEIKKLSAFPAKMQHAICCTKSDMPADWDICDGFIHPSGWVDIAMFESIFKTHNCFRVFMASSKSRDEAVLNMMASSHGVVVEDLEARRICSEMCRELFGRMTTRQLTVSQRLALAQKLKQRYRLSIRQISTLVRIPESEIIKYIR